MDKINTLDETAVSNFRTYLRFNTVHPHPNYESAVAWICEQAEQLDLTTFRTEIVAGNPVVVLRWVGSEPELRSVLLNSHMDVVPVDEAKWSHPPFGATLANDGCIYARGSQDMKCVGIQQLEAIRRLKARGISQLRRTIYLTFVPDEELGGRFGMQRFVADEKPSSDHLLNEISFSDLNVGFCLDEGIASPTDEYLAFYDERRPCWTTVRIDGSAGHGLTLLDNTAGEKFQKFLDRMMHFRAEEKLRLEQSTGQLTLGDVTSVNLTMLGGGVQHNVLPSSLTACFDVRLTPSLPLENWQKMMTTWADEAGGGFTFEYVNIGVDVWHTVPVPDPQTDPMWRALYQVCKKAGIPVSQRIFPGSTDARFIRQYHLMPNARPNSEPIQAIGFSPMRRTPVLLHDHDERLSVDQFLLGCYVYTDLLYELGQMPSR
ncbi:Aminoacylase [Fasciola hepatica]|uniref:N-acyl-aliphatic-L-amino acid amidohydrolase n=1 Tax=Fasciola hepatica TaxID=6192 RepID=A0A4E0R1V9_FASHE|nr:Aminoacylase [Fasciola hepatica]